MYNKDKIGNTNFIKLDSIIIVIDSNFKQNTTSD